MKLIDISTPKHPNTFAMVDDADYEFLNQWKWSLRSEGYVGRSQQMGSKSHTVYMHREILKPPPGMRGDHRFGNKLDNRRENLRICTHAENGRNRKPTPGRALPKGVYWESGRGYFRASIQIDSRRIRLGNFHTVSEAEAAYIAAAKKYHGEFARTNQMQESK